MVEYCQYLFVQVFGTYSTVLILTYGFVKLIICVVFIYLLVPVILTLFLKINICTLLHAILIGVYKRHPPLR